MTAKRIRNPFPGGNPSNTPKPGQKVPGPQATVGNPNFSDGIKPLNPQQRIFVKQYVALGFKATAAAEAAGYPRNYGAQLLQLPNIQDAIRREQARLERRIDITQEAVLQEIANVAFGNLAEFFNDFGQGRSLVIKPKEELTEEQQKLMGSISETWRGNNRTLKFRAHDKLRALTLLSQYLGLLDGVGRQVDPAGMVARMRAAASKGQDSMPQSVENISSEEEEEEYES